MAPLTSYGGNLIATLDFFRHGAKYYKVTEKVDLAGLEPRDVAALGFPAQLVLLKTVAHSLRILHNLEIVHSDLKPSNVLIKRTELGYTTKLIDFDSSYVVGKPPPPEEIVGTMNYYSPELVSYIQGTGNAADLTQASDIFALGLIYAEYLTGDVPPFDPAHHEAAIAVLNGATLRLPPSSAPAPVVALVERMLLADWRARPTVGEVHATLMGLRSESPTVGRPPFPAGYADRRAHAPARRHPIAGGGRSRDATSFRAAGQGATDQLGTGSARRRACLGPRPRRGGAHPGSRPRAARQADPQDRGATTPVSTLWRCAVCETVNDGGRSCTACGAPLTRRSAAATAIRARIAPAPPPPPVEPLPEPVRRAINREPVDESEWTYDTAMVPLPGGCIVVSRPRRRR